MRRLVSLALVCALALPVPGIADDERREREAWPPKYENPLVSLLFLPVRVLVRVASVFSPDEARDPRSREADRN